jgi:hypothetical protein
MQIPEQSCDHIEQALAALERRQAELQAILDTEPDLGTSQRLRLRRQIWEIGNEIIAVRTQLEQCQADSPLPTQTPSGESSIQLSPW